LVIRHGASPELSLFRGKLTASHDNCFASEDKFAWASPQGNRRERLARITETVKRHIDVHDIAGAVTLVARRGRIVQFEAYGLADLDTRKPMSRDSLFWIASMSKPITGVAILMLPEEGKVRLTDPVSKFIPEFHEFKVAMLQERTGPHLPTPGLELRTTLTRVRSDGSFFRSACRPSTSQPGNMRQQIADSDFSVRRHRASAAPLAARGMPVAAGAPSKKNGTGTPLRSSAAVNGLLRWSPSVADWFAWVANAIRRERFPRDIRWLGFGGGVHVHRRCVGPSFCLLRRWCRRMRELESQHMSRMTFFDSFRTAFDDIDDLLSVHHNVAKHKAAREGQAFGLPSLKSKAWPPNVVSIAEERARRALERVRSSAKKPSPM
jgi:hypothetical protein